MLDVRPNAPPRGAEDAVKSAHGRSPLLRPGSSALGAPVTLPPSRASQVGPLESVPSFLPSRSVSSASAPFASHRPAAPHSYAWAPLAKASRLGASFFATRSASGAPGGVIACLAAHARSVTERKTAALNFTRRTRLS